MGRLTYWTSLVVLAVLLGPLQTSASASESCSCNRQHMQTKFCQFDFVAIVTVEEVAISNESDLTLVYTVSLNQTFKVSPIARTALEQKPLVLWTASRESMCGLLGVKVGETRVVGGYIGGSELGVSRCGFTMLWSDITPRQRKGLQQLYQEGCVCPISSRYKPTDGNKTCSFWESSEEEKSCQDRYGICMLGSTGCSWTPSVAYDKCMKAAKRP